jgi:hypothetical protein
MLFFRHSCVTRAMAKAVIDRDCRSETRLVLPASSPLSTCVDTSFDHDPRHYSLIKIISPNSIVYFPPPPPTSPRRSGRGVTNNRRRHRQDGLGRAKNPVKYLQSIEQRARERSVAYETVRLLRRDVIECYRKEGVNHYENCKGPVETYARLVLKMDLGQVHPEYKDEGKKYGY